MIVGCRTIKKILFIGMYCVSKLWAFCEKGGSVLWHLPRTLVILNGKLECCGVHAICLSQDDHLCEIPLNESPGLWNQIIKAVHTMSIRDNREIILVGDAILHRTGAKPSQWDYDFLTTQSLDSKLMYSMWLLNMSWYLLCLRKSISSVSLPFCWFHKSIGCIFFK
jgi:hypothetical protein